MGESLTLHYNSFKFEMFTVASSGTDYSTILIKKIFIKKMFAVMSESHLEFNKIIYCEITGKYHCRKTEVYH